MKEKDTALDYAYAHADPSHTHAYLLPPLLAELAQVSRETSQPYRLFDLGCGNGSIGARIAAEGWEVTGVDPSREAIREGRKAYPALRLEEGSAYEDLAGRYGRFPVVISLEVVEHVYAPRDYTRTLFDLVEPGGTAIVSTPYHSYLKNCALAISGKMDAHFTALWDHGHIKFWSVPTLSALLREAGFCGIPR